jgi:hypothetical protein
MKNSYQKLFLGLVVLLVLTFNTSPIWAIDELILEPNGESQDFFDQINFGTCFETNRTLGNKQTLKIIHQSLLDEHYWLQEGISFNRNTNLINALFIDLGYRNINDSNLGFNLKFLGNQYPEYSKAANSIIPYISWESANYCFTLGLNYRFLNSDAGQLWNIFYYHTSVFEFIPYYKLGIHYSLPDAPLTTTIEVNNTDAMYAGNLGAYGLFVNNEFMVNQNVILFVNVGFRQSGSIGLAATNYTRTISCGLEERF